MEVVRQFRCGLRWRQHAYAVQDFRRIVREVPGHDGLVACGQRSLDKYDVVDIRAGCGKWTRRNDHLALESGQKGSDLVRCELQARPL